ncbi:hypothetical protein ACFVFI_39000 [Streptomyces sp. NPDC057705]|uniref:hypothetical protein n=1 Tax=Streptomyces sp. NPDC057705 TaxID=3346222 RepID=UPI0036B26CB1
MSRRAWVLAWAVLCVAGLTATAWLQAAAAPPEARPERHIKAECQDFMPKMEDRMRLAESNSKGQGSILVVSPPGTDCSDDVHDFLREAR